MQEGRETNIVLKLTHYFYCSSFCIFENFKKRRSMLWRETSFRGAGRPPVAECQLRPNITLIIDCNCRLSTEHYDKRKNFNFYIINFPFFYQVSNDLNFHVVLIFGSSLVMHDAVNIKMTLGTVTKRLVDELLSQGYKIK